MMYADAIYAVSCFVIIKFAQAIYTKTYAPNVLNLNLLKAMTGVRNEPNCT